MSEMHDLLEALDASVRKAQAVARDTRTAVPAAVEETPAVNIPEAALDLAAAEVFERSTWSMGMSRQVARGVLAVALPHLLPGLFVAHERMREGTDSTIWAVNLDAPHLPTPMLARTQANAPLFDAVAALLPDRADESDDLDPDDETPDVFEHTYGIPREQ